MVDGLGLEQGVWLPGCACVSGSIRVFDGSMFLGHRYTVSLMTFCEHDNCCSGVMSALCTTLLIGPVAH